MKIRSLVAVVFSIMAIASVMGCSHLDMKAASNEKIQMVPNDNYEGNPNPINEENMKLTAEEQLYFDQLKADLKKNSRDEVMQDDSAKE
ncbi:hypothetical protein RRV45_14190 [Bacillus sp. DTU_2020_1000418_1_SI_GHA_SEK_038]|uniref:hypothetical protein n=1 Tax=Bacillus sp. DTU_2020_1000418_1_SI_GHA_SEK_038 TaxID=3077585 RepID=UPI0028E95677|nr:hypothetical protein [Bacillus sp. DTU_2020_1000418_1_SI_GHA_SEK_038]WNS74065.1 hypothetical protein RRV45_14190 [Bacillus sp. DTU_2020_1000418_1_SI_GHA_SEK_038]